MEELKIGDQCICQAVGLEKPIFGTAEKIYSNTVLISVLKYDSADRIKVSELNFRVLARHESIVNKIVTVEPKQSYIIL